jgi:hypothetical protein
MAQTKIKGLIPYIKLLNEGFPSFYVIKLRGISNGRNNSKKRWNT